MPPLQARSDLVQPAGDDRVRRTARRSLTVSGQRHSLSPVLLFLGFQLRLGELEAGQERVEDRLQVQAVDAQGVAHASHRVERPRGGSPEDRLSSHVSGVRSGVLGSTTSSETPWVPWRSTFCRLTPSGRKRSLFETSMSNAAIFPNSCHSGESWRTIGAGPCTGAGARTPPAPATRAGGERQPQPERLLSPCPRGSVPR